MLPWLIKTFTEIVKDFFVEGGVPIWVKWLMLGGAFFFIELMHGAWVVLWFGFGAFAAMLVSVLFPEAVPYQVGTFFAVSSLLVGFARPITDRWLHNGPHQPKEPMDDFIGKETYCTEEIDNHKSKGAISFKGSFWNALSFNDDIAIRDGERVKIVDRNGLTLIVEPVRRKESGKEDIQGARREAE